MAMDAGRISPTSMAICGRDACVAMAAGSGRAVETVRADPHIEAARNDRGKPDSLCGGALSRGIFKDNKVENRKRVRLQTVYTNYIHISENTEYESTYTKISRFLGIFSPLF